MKKRIISLLLLLPLCLGLFSCDGAAENSFTTSDNISDVSDEMSTEVSEPLPFDVPVSSADNMKEHVTLGWWDNFAKFNYENLSLSDAQRLGSEAGGSYMSDEGRGLYWRYHSKQSNKATIDAWHNAGLKIGAWIEGQGDSRISIVAVKKNDDGTYQKDSNGMTSLLANHWYNWTSGDLSSFGGANETKWTGVQSFVNGDKWQGEYILENFKNILTPTYPDGREAIGYLEDETKPYSALIYDACAAKDINGKWTAVPGTVANGAGGFATSYVDPYGVTKKITDGAIAKDTASPFWLSYNTDAINFFAELGTDWFWCDNWNSWDNFGAKPVEKAFGDWSEAKFREYLKAHPEYEIANVDEFSITDYLKTQIKEYNAGANANNLNDGTWKNQKWTENEIWLAYMSFKSESNKAYNTGIYDAVKAASDKVGKEIIVGSNDFPYLTINGYDTTKMDLVHTEYMNHYNASTGSIASGDAPYSYSGHTFNLCSNTTRSKNAVLWYYHDSLPEMGKMYGFEALANNCTLYGGGQTTESIELVNRAIGKTKKYFSGRQIYAEIGVVFCAESETTYFTPGGIDNKNTAAAYMSWCHAFDELNIPYRSVQMQNLESEIDMFSVLVLPQIRSIEQSYIDEVLRPFLDNGGTLIITGKDSGKYSSMENGLKLNESALLATLAESYDGEGEIIYYETNFLTAYMEKVASSNTQAAVDKLKADYLDQVSELYNEFLKEGTLLPLSSYENLPESVATTLNYNVTQNLYFCDIVNMQYTKDTDSLTAVEEGVTVTLRLPSKLWGKELEVTLFNGNSLITINRPKTIDFELDDEFVTVTLPEFNYYVSIMIGVAK
jgi:hypothetical protein